MVVGGPGCRNIETMESGHIETKTVGSPRVKPDPNDEHILHLQPCGAP